MEFVEFDGENAGISKDELLDDEEVEDEIE